MNLLLRPLDYPSDPVWSVIILTIIAAGLALGYIVYILNEAFEELNNGSTDATKQEELLQLPSDGD
jgi:hypothetical protein|tara:strand:+ start:228 stop:425 length:198 start_codon:yes stop_codon:yes gene_type:complete